MAGCLEGELGRVAGCREEELERVEGSRLRELELAFGCDGRLVVARDCEVRIVVSRTSRCRDFGSRSLVGLVVVLRVPVGRVLVIVVLRSREEGGRSRNSIGSRSDRLIRVL